MPELRASLATDHPCLGLLSLLGPLVWLREAEQQLLWGCRSESPQPVPLWLHLFLETASSAAPLVVGTCPVSSPSSAGQGQGRLQCGVKSSVLTVAVHLGDSVVSLGPLFT